MDNNHPMNSLRKDDYAGQTRMWISKIIKYYTLIQVFTEMPGTAQSTRYNSEQGLCGPCPYKDYSLAVINKQ